MFKIVDSIFHMSRAEVGYFTVELDNYTFTIGDKISFKIYEANGLEDEPLLEKSVTATAGETSVEMLLLEADTDIGGYTSEVVDYWYEIRLNDNITLAGYDSSGPKILRLYPAGKPQASNL